jgi:hypothetical protein
MRTVIACCAALLASCASVPQVPESVLVPVQVACVPEPTPSAPEGKSASELSELSDHDLILTIAAEWLDLKAWVSQITPVLEACR